ncbi:MAG: hypothetical protein ABFR95_08055, partial [Actinomycetota bacterium]
MLHVFSLIAILVLSSPFGVVEGRAVDDTNGLGVEISVEVDRTFEAVLVRPFSSFEELPPTALTPMDDGTWAGYVLFPTAEDWQIVFDAFEAEGETFRSESVTLTDIGVDPLVVAGEPAEPVNEGFDRSTLWLVGGIGLALAALAALTYWTFAEDERSKTKDERPEA